MRLQEIECIILQEAVTVLLWVQIRDLQNHHSCDDSFVLHDRLPEASGKE